MARRPLFVAFGIPVTVDLWFLLALALFYQWSGGGRGGLLVAAAIAVFTLVHELGHATVARSFGATSEIRLSFLVGWASYQAPAPLSRTQRNLISLAGPGVELAVAVVTLVAVRAAVDPVTDLRLFVELHDAVMWAGVTLAVLNLLPLWPLDGGHVVATLLERFGPGARRGFLTWTLGSAAVLGLLGLVGGGPLDGLDRFAAEQRFAAVFAPLPEAVARVAVGAPALVAGSIFIPLFCALGAWQTLQVERRGPEATLGDRERSALADAETERRARNAERLGWDHGSTGEFPKGWGPSPWLEATWAWRAGADAAAVAAPLVGLAHSRHRWVLDRIERREVGELLELVPPSVATCPAVVRARVVHGDAATLVEAALATFHGGDEAEAFYLVAEGMAHRGDHDAAIGWLTSAVERRPDPRRVATSPWLRPLHGRREFQQLLGVAERTA